MAVYHPTRTFERRIPPSQVLLVTIPPTVYTRNVTATLSSSGGISFFKSFGRALTATLSFAGNIAFLKSFVRAFTATLSFTGNLAFVKSLLRAFTATLSFIGKTTKNVLGSGFTATLSFTGAIAKGLLYLRSFTATLLGGGGAGPAWIIDEGFEGTGAPSGWVILNGTPNYDYTTTVLDGSQSLLLQTTGAAVRARTADFTNMGEVYIYCRMRLPAGTAPGSPQVIASIQPNGGGTLLTLGLTAAMKLNFGGAIPANAVSFDTTYHVWMHYKTGTGANALTDLGFSTTSTRPASGGNYASVTTGAQVAQTGRLNLGNSATTLNCDLIYDKVRILDTQIGDNGDVAGGGGGPAATLSKLPSKALTATLSWIGAIATNLIHGGGTLFTQSLTATLSFVGSLKGFAQKVLTATLSFSSAVPIKKFIAAGFAAVQSFVGSIKKQLPKNLTATLSFTGLVAASKSFLKSLGATLSFVGAMIPKQILTRAFTATLSFVGAVTRKPAKAFAATSAFVGSVTRKFIGAGFAATLSFTGAVTKLLRDSGFTAALSFAGNLSVSKSFLKALTATLSFAGTLTTAVVHFFTRAFTATQSFVGVLARTRLFARALTATLSMTGAIKRRTGKALSAALAFSTVLARTIRKGLGAILSFVGFLFKGGAVTVLAGWVTKCFATIGISGSTANIVQAGSHLTVEKLDQTGAQIQVTGSQLTAERTK